MLMLWLVTACMDNPGMALYCRSSMSSSVLVLFLCATALRWVSVRTSYQRLLKQLGINLIFCRGVSCIGDCSSIRELSQVVLFDAITEAELNLTGEGPQKHNIGQLLQKMTISVLYGEEILPSQGDQTSSLLGWQTFEIHGKLSFSQDQDSCQWYHSVTTNKLLRLSSSLSILVRLQRFTLLPATLLLTTWLGIL